MPSDRLLAEWYYPGRAIGHHLFVYDEIESTMDVAWRLAETRAPHGAAIIAYDQTRGRGRFQRPWVSKPGDSVLLSVLVRPEPTVASKLSVIAALAVVQAVQQLSGVRCALKWPNDVLLDGKKLCGILIETRAMTNAEIVSVIGIGLNLNLDVSLYPEIAETATSLRAVSGQQLSVERSAGILLQAIDTVYADARAGQDVIGRWTALLETLGRRVTVRGRDREDTGVAEDIDADGALILRRDDGSRVTLIAGEVTLQARA